MHLKSSSIFSRVFSGPLPARISRCTFWIWKCTVQSVAGPLEVRKVHFWFHLFVFSIIYSLLLFNKDGPIQPVSVVLVPWEIHSIAMIMHCVSQEVHSIAMIMHWVSQEVHSIAMIMHWVSQEVHSIAMIMHWVSQEVHSYSDYDREVKEKSWEIHSIAMIMHWVSQENHS